MQKIYNYCAFRITPYEKRIRIYYAKKRLPNKSYTGDAGVSPAGVLEQNEGFSGDCSPL